MRVLLLSRRGDCMNRILKSLLLDMAVVFLVAMPNSGTAETSELLYKICFPKAETTPEKVEECKDEDCGLTEEVKEQPAPTIEKSQNYTLLGATDYGMMWGSNNYRVIGDERVRVLLYVIPTDIAKSSNTENTSIPYRVIQTVFFSSFAQYESSSASVSPKVKKGVEQKVDQKKEIGGSAVLQMVDLHCTAKKIKIYDNNTLYYRMVERQSKGSQCVELLWEKPRAPLQWQPVSSMTTGILADFYCKARK